MKYESEQISLHRKLVARAHQSIKAGLDLEQEKGPKEAIIQFYTNGVKDIEDALKIKFKNYADQSSVVKTRTSMQKTITQIKDRIIELEAVPGSSGIISSLLDTARSCLSSSSSDKTSNQSDLVHSPGLKHKSIIPEAKQMQKIKSQYSKESKELAHQILDEILVNDPNVKWADVVGLTAAKKALHEIVILPYLRPELFTGLRSPARGVLLFGPPGTGKTMLAKAVATESNARFFSISASSLTSKNYGEGEKLVRSLFDMARELQPSIIFIDEIDSILSERSEGEHEASRRLKTEFLLQFDGIGSEQDERILLLAATNRPFELDQAALRRLVKRIYIPLPELDARLALLKYLLSTTKNSLSKFEMDKLASKTAGYSSSDLTALAREASLGPIRELGDRLMSTRHDKIRPISLEDFNSAISIIRPSVSMEYVKDIEEWNIEKGTTGI